ncbi:RagB/SusD family nutrient uptake outer membrane protein [Bacteroides thetaiotaomicron]|nr:RagB/SusD family nutrient uptake outer membrane protein [Bacteroides thetaiotaomicron]
MPTTLRGVYYQGIRTASLFIMNVDKCLEMSQSERDDAKAQARFVRAYIYYKLIERYGPVPIMPGRRSGCRKTI